MPLFKRTEISLINIQAATAAEICQEFELDPAAKELLVPGQNPTDFLQALEKGRLSGEAVKLIAYGLPEREAVWWLCQSARVVEGNLNVAEKEALAAAEKWVKVPTAANKEAAGEAAGKTDMTGPGGWAAQAAAWSTYPTPYAPKGTIPITPAGPTAGLTAPAVAGGILLAAGLVGKPAMPEVKIPDLNAPVVAAPNVALPGAPAAPAISVAKPALPGVTVPQPGMPAVTAPQAPQVNVPSPTVPSVQLPDGIEALQVPGVPLLKKQGLKMAAPAPLGLPSVPDIATPEIPPVDQKKLAKMLKPFLELGREVAGGKNGWTATEA